MISLNAAAAAVLANGMDPNGLEVELLYDRKARVIGLRAAPGSPHARIMRQQRTGGNYIVAAKALVLYYGIEIADTYRYTPGKASGGIMTIQLDGPRSPVGRIKKTA